MITLACATGFNGTQLNVFRTICRRMACTDLQVPVMCEPGWLRPRLERRAGLAPGPNDLLPYQHGDKATARWIDWYARHGGLVLVGEHWAHWAPNLRRFLCLKPDTPIEIARDFAIERGNQMAADAATEYELFVFSYIKSLLPKHLHHFLCVEYATMYFQDYGKMPMIDLIESVALSIVPTPQG